MSGGGAVDRIVRANPGSVLRPMAEDSTPVSNRHRLDTQRHTADSPCQYDTLVPTPAVTGMGLLWYGLAWSIESTLYSTAVRSLQGVRSCKGHRQRLHTKNTLLIQSLPAATTLSTQWSPYRQSVSSVEFSSNTTNLDPAKKYSFTIEIHSITTDRRMKNPTVRRDNGGRSAVVPISTKTRTPDGPPLIHYR